LSNKSNNSNSSIRTITVLDVILILMALGGAVFSIPVIQAHQPSTVVIYRDNTCIAEYPLGEDREIHIDGHEGPMEITIKEEHVFVHESTCRKQVCVKSGKIGKSYQQLVCAPNHVLIEIRSNNKEEVKIDAIAQ